MELWIAEKPSLADGVARHLGRTAKKQGYIEIDGGRAIMTWCVGHIFELESPDFYTPDSVPRKEDGSKKIWRTEDLPILPANWKKRCTKKDQFAVIRKFAKEATAFVNVGDPDREGQLLVDEALIEAGVNPDGANVRRIWLAALDDDSVKKAIANLRSNRDYRNLRLSAEARSRADWLIGMNGTRAYTLTSKQLVTVGRVQTPTLAIVVARDQLIANFKPRDYFVPVVTMPDGTQLRWQGRATPHPGIDEEGRIINRELAEAIARKILAQCGWEVTRAEDKDVKEAPPLPHSLDSLQVHLSRTHKMSAKATLDACQALYEEHKLTTYPRTDCRYLPDSMYQDRQKLLRSLSGPFRQAAEGANPDLKSKAFNDKKITAHHAIIPTGKPLAGQLSQPQQAAYEAISKFYIAQFYPEAKFRETGLDILFDNEDTFVANTRALLSPGWRVVLGGAAEEAVAGADVSPDSKLNPDLSGGIQ